MPVTTFDVPEDLLALIDDLVSRGVARNRRELFIRALRVFFELGAHNWIDTLIMIDGVRGGLISRAAITELTSSILEKELYDAGKRAGKTLNELAIQRRIDRSEPWSPRALLKMLENFGWGRFAIDDKHITVTSPFLPAAVIHGYLESGLSMTLKRIETSGEIQAFEKVPHVVETVKLHNENPI